MQVGPSNNSNALYVPLSTFNSLPGPVARSAERPPSIRELDPRVHQHSFLEIGLEAFLSLPLIQVGQFSVTGKRICTKY